MPFDSQFALALLKLENPGNFKVELHTHSELAVFRWKYAVACNFFATLYMKDARHDPAYLKLYWRFGYRVLKKGWQMKAIDDDEIIEMFANTRTEAKPTIEELSEEAKTHTSLKRFRKITETCYIDWDDLGVEQHARRIAKFWFFKKAKSKFVEKNLRTIDRLHKYCKANQANFPPNQNQLADTVPDTEGESESDPETDWDSQA